MFRSQDFFKWLHKYEDFRALDEIPVTELDELLAKFFISLKKIMETSMSHKKKGFAIFVILY